MDACPAISVRNTIPVTDQSTGRDERAIDIDRRYRVMGRLRHDLVPPTENERISADDHCTGALQRSGAKSRVDFALRASIDDMKLPTERALLPELVRTGF